MTKLQACGFHLLAVSMLAAAGCGDRDAPGGGDSDSGEVERGGTAIIAELSDINLPSPLLFQTAVDGNLTADVMNRELLRGTWRDGRVVYQTAEESPMALARRYEYVGPDSSALRFHMRSDAKWSDGQPVTAHDVAFTYRLAGNPQLASPRQDYVQRLDSVTAVNDTTVVFHFQQRYPEMITHSTLPPMPRHVYEGVDAAQLRTHPTIVNPAGNLVVSGPWMIGQWERGQRIVLVPNPHFQPRPNLDQLVIRIIPDPTTRLVELETGGVDFMQNVPFDQIPRLREQAPHIRFEREEKRFYDYVAYNPQGFEPFGDPEIRRALGLAIDTRALIAALQMDEFAVPAGGPYSPIFEELYDPETQPPLPHEPERARQILESKGWRDTNNDGILDKDGRPFRFTFVTNVGNQRRADAMQIMQQQWRQIGVDAQLRTLEFNTFFDGLIKRNYQAAMGAWSVNLSPDLTQLWAEDSPFNITGYSNPQVSELFNRAKSQATAEAAAPLWRQAAGLIARDQPYTWLYYFDGADGVNRRLRGMRIDTYGPFQNTWEWWIPRSQQRGGGQADTTAASAAETGGA